MVRHVVIGGGSGFIGCALSFVLRSRGDHVTLISRTPGPGRMTWSDLGRRGLPACDAAVNLAGQHILDLRRRWTEAYRDEVVNSRVETTKQVVKALKQFQTAAAKLGMEPQLVDIRKPEEIAPAFDAAIRQHAGAIMVQMDALTQQNRTLIVDLAANRRLPAIYVSREFIDAGGLIAYGPSYPDLYRRAAICVDKIFRGAPVPPIFQ